jgi:IMP dehydrogenase/GMP reductase
MNFEGLTFDDVLLRPKRGVLPSRKLADVSVPALGLKIPLIAAPMPSVASVPLLIEISRLGGMGVVHRMNRTVREIWDDYVAAVGPPAVAIGLELTKLDQLYENGVRRFVLDIAHAHSDVAIDNVEYIKKYYKDVYLIAGSVATYGGADELIEAGADALRVGIGPGSVCTTRQVTGFGVPQLEAIQDVSWYVKNNASHIPIIADGGIRNSGDIVKALAAGADAVMIGGLFARSLEAQNGGVHYGCASKRVNGHNAPEGTEETFTTDLAEPLEDIVKRLTWGIRSGISYAGATNIRELQENADWIRLTDAGRKESKLNG